MKINVLPAIVLTAIFGQSANAADSCNALIQHGLSDITNTYGANYSLVVNYQKHCGFIDDSTSNRTVIQTEAELFGFGSGSGDADVARARRRIENWCNTNKDFAEQNSSYSQEVRSINTNALQAYEACQSFARKDINIDVQRSDEIARVVTVSIDSNSDGEYRFTGLVSNNYACEYYTADTEADEGKTPNVNIGSDTHLNIPINNGNIHIVCSRTGKSVDENVEQGTGKISFDHASIQVLTNAQALQLEFSSIVKEYYVTPPNTVLPMAGKDCPAGWENYEAAEGKFLIGASPEFPLSSSEGTDKIPSALDHIHGASTGNGIWSGVAHPSGLPHSGDNWFHSHGVSVEPNGAHDHGGDNLPPYLALTYCRRMGP